MKKEQQGEAGKNANKKNLKQVNIRIPVNLHKRLNYCCMATDLSPSNLVSMGLEQLFASFESRGFKFPQDMMSENLKILTEVMQSISVGEVGQIEAQNQGQIEEAEMSDPQVGSKNNTNAQSHNRNKSSDGENMFSSEQKNFTLN